MGEIIYTKEDIKRTHELAKKLGWSVQSISLEKAGEVLKLSRRSIYSRIAQKQLNTKYVIKSQRVLLDHLFEYELEIASTRVKVFHHRKKK